MPPTWFSIAISDFSYDDLNSWDSINAFYKRLNGFDQEDIDPALLAYEEKKSLLDSCPITAARHFNYRVRQLYNLMKKHSIRLFGYSIKDYTYRVEFQNRGSDTSALPMLIAKSFDLCKTNNCDTHRLCTLSDMARWSAKGK